MRSVDLQDSHLTLSPVRWDCDRIYSSDSTNRTLRQVTCKKSRCALLKPEYGSVPAQGAFVCSHVNAECKTLCFCSIKVTNVHTPKPGRSRKQDSHGDVCSPPCTCSLLQCVVWRLIRYAKPLVRSVIKNLNFSLLGRQRDEVRRALSQDWFTLNLDFNVGF